jgi:AcrR family transcriptional regulator
VPRTARERIHEEVTREILTVARAHLAQVGATALSLRSIARDLGMAPSALYRYFSGRDALLSTLILGAYESLADAATVASDAAFARETPAAERWLAAPRAMRAWALEHPHEWGLIFGSPVPGYEAPEDTVVPYARLATAVVRPIAEGQRNGRADIPVSLSATATAEMAAALAPVAEFILPGAPTQTVVLAIEVWTALIGVISLEVFGHWRNTVLEPGLLFEAAVGQAAEAIGLQ